MLGTCGLVFCFLPVLATTLAVIGLTAAGYSLIRAAARWSGRLRWPAMSAAVCATSVAANLLIAYAPIAYVPHAARNPGEVPSKPFVAPPSLPLGEQNAPHD
jgi:hypothetical protein